jgi:hypothetical protein
VRVHEEHLIWGRCACTDGRLVENQNRTGGDAVTMSMNLGYLAGTAIFAAIFAAAVATQINAKRFHPFLYWTVIVATTTRLRQCGRPPHRYRQGPLVWKP